MTDGIPAKNDDVSLFYRRIELEKRGVVIRLQPGTFPLAWRARWPDHELGPLPMPELIPAVEKLLPPVEAPE